MGYNKMWKSQSGWCSAIIWLRWLPTLGATTPSPPPPQRHTFVILTFPLILLNLNPHSLRGGMVWFVDVTDAGTRSYWRHAVLGDFTILTRYNIFTHKQDILNVCTGMFPLTLSTYREEPVAKRSSTLGRWVELDIES